MSQILHPPGLVKLIVGILACNEELAGRAVRDMEQLWGGTDIISDIIPFNYTDYYRKEMGEGLLRMFVSFEELILPGQIAQIKHRSNVMEAEISNSKAGQRAGVARPVNLDPGYISPSKLVLVTTKDYSHRVYIGDNMYAEATLHYTRGQWRAWPFSYPDYASGDYFDFFNRARTRLMEQLSSKKNTTL